MRSKFVSQFVPSIALWIGVGTGILALPATASACGAPCFMPGPFPSEGDVPANAVQFLTTGGSYISDGGYEEKSLRVFRVSSDGGTAEVDLMDEDLGQGIRRFTPTEPLAAGTELRLEHTQASCFSTPRQTSSTVSLVAAAPAPTELGTLEIEAHEGSILLTDDSASCASYYQSAYADLNVVLSSSAIPFRDVLRYSVVVDGEVFDQDAFDYSEEADGWLQPSLGGGPLGRGVGRIYATCAQFDPEYADFRPHPLAPDKHQVQMVAHLPDGTRLATEEHEVTLALTRCSATNTGDSGSVDTGDSTVSSAADAANPAPDPQAARRHNPGCSIAAAPTRAPDTTWLWAFAAGLAWAGRRSRRPSYVHSGAR
jgi:hypothetical protein